MYSKKAGKIGGAANGSISKYQLTISQNTVDDKEFIHYVAALGEKLFGIVPAISDKKGSLCTNIVFSGKKLTEYLVSRELPMGDKIRAHLDIPSWIGKESDFIKVCVRGLFDTDGSIFLEVHRINGKCYSYPRMSLVSSSMDLRLSVQEALACFDIKAKIRGDRSVNIENFTDIQKYFKIIGSSNQKHLRRYTKFGGVG